MGPANHHAPRHASDSAGQVEESSNHLDEALQIVDATGEGVLAAGRQGSEVLQPHQPFGLEAPIWLVEEARPIGAWPQTATTRSV